VAYGLKRGGKTDWASPAWQDSRDAGIGYRPEWWEKVFGNAYGNVGQDFLKTQYNKNPLGNLGFGEVGAGGGYAGSALSKSQAQGKMNYLKDSSRFIFPNVDNTDLNENQINQLFPFGGGGYGAEQAGLYRAAPDPGKIPDVLSGRAQNNFNTIEKANQLGYFFNPGQAYDPSFGLGGIGPTDFYQESLKPGAGNPATTNWPSITGYGLQDNFAGGGSAGGGSVSGQVTTGGATVNGGCPTGTTPAPGGT